MTTALITGGAGFIGSHLCEALIERGDQVIVLDDLSTGRRENLHPVINSPRFSFVEGSVLEEDTLGQLIARSDIVFHLAAAVGVKWILEHPLRSLETNVRGTEAVLRQACLHGRKVLLASTSEVYGKNDAGALSEDDDRILGSSRLSRWFYSSAKAIDESFALAYWQEKQLPVVIVRFFNTVGPRQTGRYGMVVPRFVRQALLGEPVTVYGTGSQTRCFTYVSDVVRAVIALSEAPEAVGEVFNIGQPREISILDLAGRIIQLTGSRSPIEMVSYDQAYGDGYEDMRRRVPDTSKLRRVTGFEPRIGLDEALERIVAAERQASSMAPQAR